MDLTSKGAGCSRKAEWEARKGKGVEGDVQDVGQVRGHFGIGSLLLSLGSRVEGEEGRLAGSSLDEWAARVRWARRLVLLLLMDEGGIIPNVGEEGCREFR